MKRLLFMLGLAALVLTLASVVALCLFPMVSDDIFLYLQVGETILETGSIPTELGYTYTLPDYECEMMGEWLNCVLFTLVHRIGGIDGLILFKTLLVAVFVLCAAAVLRMNGRVPPGAAAVVLLGAYAAADRFLERSSLFSDVFFCVLLVLLLALSRRGMGRKARLWLIVSVAGLFAVWGNTNAGYWPALAAIFCFFLGDALSDGAAWLAHRRGERSSGRSSGRSSERSSGRCSGGEMAARATAWIACGLAAFSACFANPFFHRTVFFPFKLKADAEELSSYYGEYMPTFTKQNFAATYQLHAFIALAAILVLALLFRWRRRPIKEALTAALLIYASTLFVRFLSFSAMGMAILAVHILSLGAEKRDAHEDEKPEPDGGAPASAKWLAGAHLLEAAAGLVFFIVVATGGYRSLSGIRNPGMGLNPDVQPEAAAGFIERNGLETARIYNQHEAGAYLIWRFGGSMKVFFHGWVTDNDFYFNEYYAANRSSDDFERIVERYGLDGFLLMRPPPWSRPDTLPPVYSSLYPSRNPRKSPYRTESPWKLVYWDNRYVFYLRDTPAFRDVIERNHYVYADPVMIDRYFLGMQNDPQRAMLEKERAKRVFSGLRLPLAWRRLERPGR